METIKEVVNTQEEIAPAETEEEVVNDSPEAAAETESTAATVEKTTSNTETTNEEPPKTTKKQEFNGNLLYEESLGFVPGNHGESHDPRYVFCKFRKYYKDFDYTNEDILEYLVEINLLNYLRLLQISKPNLSEELPPQMELETPEQGTSVGESDANSEHSEDSWKIVTDGPMLEVSLTSKRVRELE